VATSSPGAQHPAPPLAPIPEVDVREQLLAAHRLLADWQPGSPLVGVRWAAGVMQAQHATHLSRFWRTGDHADLHSPWGFHVLDRGRLFEHDRDAAWVDDRDVVLARVSWEEVADLLIPVDSGLRHLVDEVAAVHDAFREAGHRDAVWYDVRQLIQLRSFQAAAAVWESVRPANLLGRADTCGGGGRRG
jgi:hypothetical protein